MKKSEFSDDERTLIEEYADRWNEKFKGFTGGHYVGRCNVERMLTCFLRSVKQKTLKRRS
jgi:hypothetical protein